MMAHVIQRYSLLMIGVTLAAIGVVYSIDPNLLLSRYELSVAGASEDNMYRGAYGGLFITLGAAVSFGYFAESFRQTATIIALLFMGGFALGRIASIIALGMPHQLIVGLLMFEIVSSALFIYLLLSQRQTQIAE